MGFTPTRLGACLLAAALWALPSAARALAAPGETVGNFRLLDQDGRSRELYRQTAAPAVVLFSYGVGCPIARRSLPALRKLRARFAGRGVIFWLVDSAPQDGREELQAEAREFAIDFPILHDAASLVALSLDISRTGEAIVLSPDKWKVVYRGRVDDRQHYDGSMEQAGRPLLASAIEAALAGRPADPARTEAFGCILGGDFARPASYALDAGPILVKRCMICHRCVSAGWKSHRQVSGWAPMIRETIMTGRMPMWAPDPAHGDFAEAVSLSTEEARTLVRWLDAGAPRGDGPDPLAAVAPFTGKVWRYGQPDRILDAGPQEVAADDGAVRAVKLGGPLTEDLLLQTVEIHTLNRRALHHANIYAVPEEELRLHRGTQVEELFAHDALGSIIAGLWSRPLKKGDAMRVKKGAQLFLYLHYEPTGRAEKDSPQVGLTLHRGAAPDRLLSVTSVKTCALDIPPGATDYHAQAQSVLEHDSSLIWIFPHMHCRGVSLALSVVPPGEPPRILLSIPDFRCRGVSAIQLKRPLALSAGTKLIVEGVYDNSSGNPLNPDPAQRVRCGMRASEEMLDVRLGWLSAPGPPSGKR